MLEQIHELDIAGLERAYRRRQLDPVQVCEHLLARIDDPRLNCNAFAHVARDAALAAARAAGERWRGGAARGPLDGIPLAIKDVLDVAGMPTRHGSPACAEVEAAADDCLLAQRLRAAGAVILGKTRTWELAWRSNPARDPAQVVRNPHDPARSPGGSSSGSAAAVAAGLCPLAFGTDSGGSVRGPASSTTGSRRFPSSSTRAGIAGSSADPPGRHSSTMPTAGPAMTRARTRRPCCSCGSSS